MVRTAERSVLGREQSRNLDILVAGRPLETAGAAMVLVHGRGGTAQGILSLAEELWHPGFSYVAPQAAGNSWYPFSFLAPLSENEPQISAALATVEGVLDLVLDSGLSAAQTILLGFSQGACLALEFAARNARRYGGVVGLSGGLIGPEGTPRAYPGSMEGTPVFLGCSDRDPHIPAARVVESGEVMQRLGAQVTSRLYPKMGHTVNGDELEFVRSLMEKVVKAPSADWQTNRSWNLEPS